MKKSDLKEIPTHICAHCGRKWQEMTLDDAWHVLQAVQVNKQGPWCNLCHHLKMAEVFAEHRKESRALYRLRDILTVLRKQQ